MNELRSLLYTPAAARRIDAYAIERLGIAGSELMERAGMAAYRALRQRWPQARRLVVLCGPGNNGGDGYVLARLALDDGLAVTLLQLGDHARLRGEAQAAAEAYRQAGGATQPFRAGQALAADVLVDAMVGTGLDRPLVDDWAAAVQALNHSAAPVLALDIPSGLHGASGAILGSAVKATATMTFIAQKSGLFTGSGPAVVGELELASLAVPMPAFASVTAKGRLIGRQRLLDALPPRQRDAHKGDHGHVLVIGGDHGMGGAVRMAAEAAGRVGAGLVTVASRAEHCSGILAARPELMCHGISEPDALQPLLAKASVLVLGPGLGQDDWGRGLFEAAASFDGPMLIDADGLNLLAEMPRHNQRWVLTPHPGEAARLLATTVSDIQQDRYAAAAELAGRYGGVAVLKGAGSIVQQAGALPEVSTTGNPGMAAGGMGDVLSGVIGGLLAQGLPQPDAAAVGVWVHGAAADRVAAAGGERGLLALDLMASLRELVNP